jgi:death-on-curing protein
VIQWWTRRCAASRSNVSARQVRADDIERLLQEIDGLIREEFALEAGSDETIRRVRLLTAAACLLNERALASYGGHPGENRGIELVEQVVAAAFQSFAGEERHPEPFDKAAMLLRGITQGHPFGDGNKRTGFMLAAYYLDIVGFTPTREWWDADSIEELGIAVSSGEVREVAAIAERLRSLWGVKR